MSLCGFICHASVMILGCDGITVVINWCCGRPRSQMVLQSLSQFELKLLINVVVLMSSLLTIKASCCGRCRSLYWSY
jgi:hypothetical protein